MGIKSPQEYIESLKDGRVVYCNGKRIEDVTEDPILKVCRDWVAMDYVLNQDPNGSRICSQNWTKTAKG